MSAAVGNDDYLRNYPCPNCAVRGQVVWNPVAGIYVCHHCRTGGMQPFEDAPERGRPPHNAAPKREKTPPPPDILDTYTVGEGRSKRKVVVQYHLPADPEPPTLRDPKSREWQETWGNFVRWERADVIAQERRVERDRLRRHGAKAPKRRQ